MGLHISKLISEQLGGDIDCQSVWQEGTVMTFVIACEKKITSEKEIKRFKNPVGIKYPKFELNIEKYECPEVLRRKTNVALENMINNTPHKNNEDEYSQKTPIIAKSEPPKMQLRLAIHPLIKPIESRTTNLNNIKGSGTIKFDDSH